MENTLSLKKKNKLPKKKKEKAKKDRFGEDYEYSPVRRKVAESSVFGGLVVRCAVIAVLVFGLTLFFDDCFSLDVGFFKLILYAVVWSAAFGACFCGGKKTLFGLIGVVLLMGVFVIIAPGNALNYAVSSVRCTLTCAGERFVRAGYDNLSFLLVGYKKYASESRMNGSTFFLFTAVIAFVLNGLNIRKVRLLPTLIFSLIVLGPGITYNFIGSNWGFAFAVLSLFALLAVRLFEKCYKAKKEDRERCASLGGYFGGAVALAALVCILIPAVLTDGRWSDIPAISKPIDVARDVVTSVISGDMPNLQEMGLIKNMDEHNSRVVSSKVPSFTGESMLTVKRKTSSSAPVYIRGWAASPDFDGNAWYSPTNDESAAYDALFSELSVAAGYGEKYSPDYMTEVFYELLFDTGALYDESLGYKNYPELGFNVYRADIELEVGKGMGNLLYLPSTSLVSGGLDAFEDTAAYGGKAEQFHNGMMITGWLNLNKAYSVTAVSTNFSGTKSSERFTELLHYVTALRNFIKAERNGTAEGELRDIYDKYIALNVDAEILESYIDTGAFYGRYMAMSEEEKQILYTKCCLIPDAYTDYVRENYVLKEGKYSNKYVKELVDDIDFRGAVSAHERVMAVVQHIVSNYKYTLTPEAGTAEGLTPFEQFVSETKEGYCTNLATLLTLALREIGVPARYVEGYLANSFLQNDNGEYVADLKDTNAHAWVEVYYEGYGWVAYEAARNYAKAIYGADIRLPLVGVPSVPETPDVPEAPEASNKPAEELPVPPIGGEGEVPENSMPWGIIFKAAAIIAVAVTAVVLVFRLLKKRADDALYFRRHLLEKAVQGANKEEYPELSHGVNAELFALLKLAGYAPSCGEFPSEYALRMDADCPYTNGRFSEIMTLMQKQEFGQSLSNSDLRVISEYTSVVWSEVYRNMSAPKRFWYRYVALKV